MADKKIPDLVAASTVNDTDVLELCQPGVVSQKVTALQLQTYVNSAFPLEFSAFDDGAVEYFDDYALGAITTFDKGQGWGANGVGTGCTIVNKTMADGRTQNRLSMNAGTYGRLMPWGALWNRIKICLVLRINHGVTFANTNGYIGVCTGTTNMSDSATTTNFAGIRWGDGTGTSTFTAGLLINYFDVPTFRAVTRRVNTTTDRGGLSSGHAISANEGYLSAVLMEMSRPVFANDAASVNYSIAQCGTISTGDTQAFSRTKEVARRVALGSVTTTLATDPNDTLLVGSAGVTATPFAFDQSTGVLNTINFYWPQALPLEIAGFALRKVY